MVTRKLTLDDYNYVHKSDAQRNTLLSPCGLQFAPKSARIRKSHDIKFNPKWDNVTCPACLK